MNRNKTMVLKITREWGMTESHSNSRFRISTLQTVATGPIADAGHQPCKVEANKGAGFQPCKMQEQVELRVQDFNLAKLKQTRANRKKKPVSKHQDVQLHAARPQLCKVEENNNKQHPTNQ
jgi:hypothetical protein